MGRAERGEGWSAFVVLMIVVVGLGGGLSRLADEARRTNNAEMKPTDACEY